MLLPEPLVIPTVDRRRMTTWNTAVQFDRVFFWHISKEKLERYIQQEIDGPGAEGAVSNLSKPVTPHHQA
jgi:hypothetical protein